MNTSFWILLVLGFVLIIAATTVKVITSVNTEPKFTIDYLEEYNKISKPDGFDPNDNADELYKKAAEGYANPTKVYEDDRERVINASELLKGFYYLNKDINEVEKSALREWFEKNRQCMEYLKEGNKKKFYWIKQNVQWFGSKDKNYEVKKDNEIDYFPKSILARLFEDKAKLEAIDGHFEDALNDLIECWEVGHNSANPNLVWADQTFAMRIQEGAIEAAFQILEHYKLDVNTLRMWQEKWQKIFDEDTYRPGFKSDHLLYYGYAQQYFAYDPNDKGRLSEKKAKEFEDFEDQSYIDKDGQFHQLYKHVSPDPHYYCISGATSKEFKSLVDNFFDHYETIKNNTPWSEYHNEQNFKKEIEEWKTKHPLPKGFYFPGLKPDWTYFHRIKAKKDALVTIIAIQRYKIDQGRYPENLEILCGQLGFNYLTKLPQDPFSEGLLVYHRIGDDFELYSVGPDFKDDGGKRCGNSFPLSGSDQGDDVFWPPMRKQRENVKFFHTSSDPNHN